MVYNILIEYYGEDKSKIIFEAIYNTQIIILNKDKKGIYKELKCQGLKKTYGVVAASALKIASGIHCLSPIIQYIKGEYILNGVETMVIVNAFELEKNHFIGTLVHELSHLIKSYNNAHKITANTFYNRSGLHEKKITIYTEIFKN